MPKCPNCAQSTTRTEDWACQWCGYPLLSTSYKKNPKTFKQIKEEKSYQLQPLTGEEAEISPQPSEDTLPLTHKTEPETEPVPQPVTEQVPEAVGEITPETRPEPVPQPETEQIPEAVSEITPETRPEPVPQPETEQIPEAAGEITPETRPEPVPQPEIGQVPEAVAEIKPETEPAASVMEITVEYLLSAYETDGKAADTQFANQTLKITGNVGRIEVKETLDIYYVSLISTEKERLHTVRCVFDRAHGVELNQLEPGQTITVQGIYDGSIIDIRMRDCILVK